MRRVTPKSAAVASIVLALVAAAVWIPILNQHIDCNSVDRSSIPMGFGMLSGAAWLVSFVLQVLGRSRIDGGPRRWWLGVAGIAALGLVLLVASFAANVLYIPWADDFYTLAVQTCPE